MNLFIVRGRSIDGTVYWDGMGWALGNKYCGKQLTQQQAQQVVEQEYAANKQRELDATVGHLTVVDAPHVPQLPTRTHRERAYAMGFDYWRQLGYSGRYRPRRVRRYERRALGVDAIMDAHYEGEAEAYRQHPRNNPYPPGRRHDAWQQAFNTADPFGSHMGSNY